MSSSTVFASKSPVMNMSACTRRASKASAKNNSRSPLPSMSHSVSKPFSGAGKINMKRTPAFRPVSANSDAKEVFGMDASEGFFGFNPFAELWVGRLAMMGFVTSVVEEAVTGNGTLRQIGLDAPSTSLLATMLAVFGGATLVSVATTLRQAQDGSMPAQQAARFRALLGLDRESSDIEQTRKNTVDPVLSAMTDNESDISAARAAGTAADKFFSDETSDASAAAKEMKAVQAAASSSNSPSVSLKAKADILEQRQFNSELAYAKDVEMQNGRYAMLGFLAAILVEAGTGHGIIMQIIDIFKLVGLLGAESGF